MSTPPSQPPLVQRVLIGLARSEISGVNAHSLAVAWVRLSGEYPDLNGVGERQIAIALLERSGYPGNINEFSAFLSVPQPFGVNTLLADEISDAVAPHYIRWLPAFLEDPDPNIQRNARTILRWLVAHRREAIAAAPESLDNLRKLADEATTSWRASAAIVYGLGGCGGTDDYDRVIRHAEQVIAQDRENLDLVAEGLYRLYPPALINAIQFFIDQSGNKKEFVTGLVLLEKVTEIEDHDFWQRYEAEMDALIASLRPIAVKNHAVERLIDQIEKQMALSGYEGDGS